MDNTDPAVINVQPPRVREPNGSTGSGGNIPSRDDLRDVIAYTARWMIVLSAVWILSIGMVLCAGLFIWCCFQYPSAANTLLPVLGAGVGSLLVVYARRMVALLASHHIQSKIGLLSVSTTDRPADK